MMGTVVAETKPEAESASRVAGSTRGSTRMSAVDMISRRDAARPVRLPSRGRRLAGGGKSLHREPALGKEREHLLPGLVLEEAHRREPRVLGDRVDEAPGEIAHVPGNRDGASNAKNALERACAFHQFLPRERVEILVRDVVHAPRPRGPIVTEPGDGGGAQRPGPRSNFASRWLRIMSRR